jgi:hypothetical protein
MNTHDKRGRYMKACSDDVIRYEWTIMYVKRHKSDFTFKLRFLFSIRLGILFQGIFKILLHLSIR